MKMWSAMVLVCAACLSFTSCQDKKAKDKIKDQVEKTENVLEDTGEQIGDKVGEVKEALNDIKDQVGDSVKTVLQLTAKTAKSKRFWTRSRTRPGN